ncbi:hypothetical protein F5Y10DRAFT_294077 [Nemania abortiva]|nr:hypothetical protein F5Y10DRAFT_294077 [Nemania abortiva]
MAASTQFGIETVAVIGAGPSGIAAAKITVFEQRSRVGGIWNTDFGSPAADATAYPSPVYHEMESNIPSEIMQYHNKPFPPDVPLLPDAEQVLRYLRAYAEDVIPHIQLKLRHEVIDTRPMPPSNWVLKVRDLETETLVEEVYDAVVVANGRYNKPYEPTIPGLYAWKQRYPDTVLHSKYFRDAKRFKDKKVLIIGFSSSGVDLANAIEPLCSKPLLICQKSADGLSPGSKGFAEGRTVLPSIIGFNAEDRSVLFSNGVEELGIDNVLLCTGYEYEYPFLSSLPGFENGRGDGNDQTYQHIFYMNNARLSFITAPLRVVAFPFAETQAAVVARVWSGRLSLPSNEDMVSWVERTKKLKGSGKDFHKMSYPDDADYMDEMYNWCQQAKSKQTGKSLAAPSWGKRERWLRGILHDIRRATEARGEERFLVKTVEDAGFQYTDNL